MQIIHCLTIMTFFSENARNSILYSLLNSYLIGIPVAKMNETCSFYPREGIMINTTIRDDSIYN